MEGDDEQPGVHSNASEQSRIPSSTGRNDPAGDRRQFTEIAGQPVSETFALPLVEVVNLARRKAIEQKTHTPAGRDIGVWNNLVTALSSLHFDANGEFIESPHALAKIANLAGVNATVLDFKFKR